MGDLTKWVSLILLWATALDLGLCTNNETLAIGDDDDSVVVEARSLPNGKNSRSGRQLEHIQTVNWFQAFGEGNGCLTSIGAIGACSKFRTCYPNFRNLNYFVRQSENPWFLEGQETCNFFDEYGQQATGICCVTENNQYPNKDREEEQSQDQNGDIPTGTSSYEEEQSQAPTGDGQYQETEDSSEYQFHWPSQPSFPSAPAYQWPPQVPTHAPVISQWPPQAPTHPPDHHYPTHPPHPALPTYPPVTITSARPTYPSYHPTQRPTYPSYVTTARPMPRPPVMDHLPVPGSCGAKNGASPDQERIVGGQNSSPNEWPWIVVLFNKGKQFCGGSLIDNIHILTAAHCVARMTSWDVAGLTAHLGDHNIRTTFEVQHVERKIKRLVRHKGFSFSTLHNDVAVLTLDRPVTYTREIRPICLPYSSIRKSFSGHVATVAGWGSLRENGPQPGVLQKVNIPIWENSECARKYGRSAPGGIIQTMLCAGQAARDSCSGDSGGPLMVSEGGQWTQIGIVSWGIGCGKGQYPGVYTRVTEFLPWIMKNLK